MDIPHSQTINNSTHQNNYMSRKKQGIKQAEKIAVLQIVAEFFLLAIEHHDKDKPTDQPLGIKVGTLLNDTNDVLKERQKSLEKDIFASNAHKTIVLDEAQFREIINDDPLHRFSIATRGDVERVDIKSIDHFLKKVGETGEYFITAEINTMFFLLKRNIQQDHTNKVESGEIQEGTPVRPAILPYEDTHKLISRKLSEAGIEVSDREFEKAVNSIGNLQLLRVSQCKLANIPIGTDEIGKNWLAKPDILLIVEKQTPGATHGGATAS